MYVKNITVSTLLLTAALCASAGTLVPISATGGVRTDYNEANSVVTVFSNVYKQATGTLNRDDTLTHTKTVIFAASNLETGQTVEWTNPANSTAGRVKVVMSRPAQGGYCRMLFTQVEKDNVIRDYTEWACKTIDSKFWTFSER
jgi:surface antigen